MTTIPFTDNGRTAFDLRYPRKNDEGKPAETPEETVDRVVRNVAVVNALYDNVDQELASVDLSTFPWSTAIRQAEWLTDHRADANYIERIGSSKSYAAQRERYREIISSLTFLPNSPTWTGAGTPLGQLAACFVLPINDDLAVGESSIFMTLRTAALIQQTGGGNGFSFSKLRPGGSVVNRSMGRASGPVGFMKVYDGAFGEIAQGGSRRGANMAVLRVDHPDIYEFVKAKVEEGKISNFNISVGITDAFMEAVECDGDFLLHWGLTSPTDDPVEYEIERTIRAKELFDYLVNNAWVIGDPGCLFLDRANDANPVPTRYVLESTNPCGEQWLGPFENCCLGSINIGRFVTKDWEGDDYGTFNWDSFAEVIHSSTQFLDDVVDANQYVPEVRQLEEAALGARRIGLGLMGVADAMVRMGVRYGDAEGLDFLNQVMEFFRYHTMVASIERARERGPFEWIKNSIYDPELLAQYGEGGIVESVIGVDGKPLRLWARPAPGDGVGQHLGAQKDYGRPDLYWESVFESLLDHGIRNACQLTMAPTGTISTVAGCEGSGGEPMFALSFVRTVMQEQENIKLDYLSGLFEDALARSGVSAVERQEILERVIANGGSCQGVEGVPPRVQHVFAVAADVTPEEHVLSQAVMQTWVDNSISKTINMPHEATVEDVANAYMLAYRSGCKGITIYRQGSRQLEVLTVTRDKEGHVVDWPTIVPLAIPSYAKDLGLPARVYPVETAVGRVQVTITQLEGHDDRPFDVRLQLGKAGNDANAHVEALGRMISLSLRAGIAAEWIVEQLEGIGGQTSLGMGPNKVRSVADGVAKLFRRLYLPDADWTTASTADEERLVVDRTLTCPNCGTQSVVVEQGCRHCDIRLGGCGDYSACD